MEHNPSRQGRLFVMTTTRFKPLLLLAALLGLPSVAAAEDQVFTIFDRAEIQWEKDLAEEITQGALVIRNGGQVIETTIDLPDAPADQRDARRLTATIEVEPVLVEAEGKSRPGDPWTRLGNLSVVKPDEKARPPTEVEIVRFITGFGGAAKFEQDVTALAPLLSGKTTFRIHISTWLKPGWRVNVKLTSSDSGAGYRRPVFAKPLFNDPNVTAEKIAGGALKATLAVPQKLEQPRLRILTTGHATDGTGGDEFITRTHILLVDGNEVARWRPWSESGGAMRQANPMSGRLTIDGRELWSSDLDRSGWHPGRVVEPLIIPLPELGPGLHTIELRIEDIRPKDKSGQGYWRVSAIVLADEPWPVNEQTTKKPDE